jgi:site-specific DNA-methyltransferase (adenine-specific)
MRLKTERAEVIWGDCLDVLPTLPDNAADLVLTSPPYNMNLRINSGRYCSRQITKEFSTKYDGFPDNLPIEDYFEFNRRVIVELLRVAPCVFYNMQIVTGNKPAVLRLLGHFADQIKELIVWDKKTAQPAMKFRVLNSQYELIIVFQRENAMGRQLEAATFERGTMSNLWQIKRGAKVHKDHGATFPLELAERVICNFSKEGDTVLDPFFGTGQTGVAALANNRKVIGVELLAKYFAISCARIVDKLENKL